MKNGTQERAVNILIVMDNWQGHTTFVTRQIVAGCESAGANVRIKTADESTQADLHAADALIMGSAIHQRGMTWKMKRFVDEICEPAWFYDDIVGRVGAVFTVGGGHGQAGGGAEQAQIDMLANLAACGMVLVTLPKCTPGYKLAEVHWGPTIKATDHYMCLLAPEALDVEAQQAFYHHGANVARIAQRLFALELATGNRWPSREDREARARSEAHRPLTMRMPSSADPDPRIALKAPRSTISTTN